VGLFICIGKKILLNLYIQFKIMKKNKQVLNNASVIKNNLKSGQKKEIPVRITPLPPPVTTSTTVETTTIPENVVLEQPVIKEKSPTTTTTTSTSTSTTTDTTTTNSIKNRLPNITNKK